MIQVSGYRGDVKVTAIVGSMGEAWELIHGLMTPGSSANIHVKDTDNGQTLLLYQDGEFKYLEDDAMLGFLDMVFEKDPLRALRAVIMAYGLLAGLEEFLDE